MSISRTRRMTPKIIVLAALAAASLLLFPTLKPVIAEDIVMVTQETLLDRIQIEDLLTQYYVNLTSGSGHDLAQYFTEDAVLDVNGMIAEGRDAIKKLYGGESGGEEANLGSKVHMLLSNPIINVKGNTATAWLIWTGVMNDNIRLAPRLMEQGREYTELVKRNGRWYIKKRYVSADSGMPAIWDETYKPRKHR